MNPTAREQWPQQHAWLKERLESFRAVLGPRVKSLNANAYVPDAANEDAPEMAAAV